MKKINGIPTSRLVFSGATTQLVPHPTNPYKFRLGRKVVNHFHEDNFCPVTCPIAELAEAIKAAPSKERLDFLRGVEHARILIAGFAGKPEIAS